MSKAAQRRAALRFRQELQDFFQFIARPRLAPRLAPRRPGQLAFADWTSGLRLRRLLQWVAFLWAVNLVFLGPIAVAAATAGGAQHRLDIQAIPWLQALLWAPVVEELVFRYGLRRFAQSIWVVPPAVALMLNGPSTTSVLVLIALLLLCMSPRFATYSLGPRPRSPGRAWAYQRAYQRRFGWVFHGASLAFAAVHLYNFNLHQTPLWLLPLLVLPQWLTGMVLGWRRVRFGIGSAMALHALFNAGPLLVVWLIVRLSPGLSL